MPVPFALHQIEGIVRCAIPNEMYDTMESQLSLTLVPSA